MNRADAVSAASHFARYFPGVLAVVLTAGVSFANRVAGVGLGLPTAIALAVPPTALVASVVAWTDRDPSGLSLLVVAALSWGVFSLARIPLVDPSAARIVGSPFALLDFGLVWLGSYAVVGAVVYGTDWPTPGTEADADRDRSGTDVADD